MPELEFSHITTRGGDSGSTSLMGGERRRKSDILFSVLGDIDELSSQLGVCRALLHQFDPDSEQTNLSGEFITIQRIFITIGGELASLGSNRSIKGITDQEVVQLELWEKTYLKGLQFSGFIIPGAHMVTSHIDLARAVCRRTERHLVQLIEEQHERKFEVIQEYINRLSDYLFVCGRHLAKIYGLNET